MATKKKVTKNTVKQEPVLHNGLADALQLGNGPFGNPTTTGDQLGQADSLFNAMRWYQVSNYRQLLSEAHVEIGLVKTIVNLPVDDAFRGGVEITTDQISPEEIKDLITEMDRNGDLKVIAQARKWTRLFGGGGVIILTDQDPESELDPEALTEDSPLQFRAVDMWELYDDKQSTGTASEKVQITGDDDEHFSYYSEKIHPSRVMKMMGEEAPSFVRPRLRGWGLSVVEVLIRSLNQYIKANNVVFEVIDEFKIDIYRLKGLANTLLNKNGNATVLNRVQMMNMQKNFQNAIVMDLEDEYEQKELGFAGISETLVGIRMAVASDLRMPLTKIFGISAAGFSSGEDDIENYNAMIESEVREKSKYEIIKMIELRCQRKFGFIPDDIGIEFKPLRVLSSEQEENVKTSKYGRLESAVTKGLITLEEFKDAVNKEKLLPIQIDPKQEKIEMAPEEGAGGPPAGKTAKVSTTAPKDAKD